MKKILVFILMAGIIGVTGCKKKSSDNTTTSGTLSNKDLIAQIFTAGMSWNDQAKLLKSTYPINIQVENTVNGPLGGYIHVIGSVTGSMTVNDQTGEIMGGTMLLGLTETINDYAFGSNGKTYTMNGDPYISLAGTFTLLPGGATFGTASSMEIGGGVHVSGPGVNQTINIQITIIINTNGTGGTVSGTIGGNPVNFSF
jgi:hypothetical protein